MSSLFRTAVLATSALGLISAPVLAAEVAGPVLPQAVAPVSEPAAESPASAESALGPGSEGLVTAVDLAMRGYPSIASARSQARAARANLRGAKWQRFPSASVEVLATGTNSADRDVALTVEEPIWTAGRIGGTIRLSRAQYDAAQAAVGEVALDIALRVSAVYFDFQRLALRETILEDSLGEHRKLVESMERRVARELSAASDLELARSRAAQVEQELVVTNGSRRMALTRLRELTGDSSFQIGSIFRYDATLHHPDPSKLIDDALAYDPKRRRLMAEVKIAEADIDVRKAAIFPQLNAQYQKPLYGSDRLGIVLRAQNDGGFARFSAVDAARQRRRTAELNIVSNERELRELIEADLLENSVAKGRIASSNVSATSAQAVTESFMRQFVAGKRTWFDVMNAVRESMTARLSEVDARVSAVASATRLSLRSGHWRPLPVEDTQN